MPGQHADAEKGMAIPLQSAKAAAKPQASSAITDLRGMVRKPDFMVTWLFPLFCFAVVLLLYTLHFMHGAGICVALSIMLFFTGSVMVSMRNRGHIWLPLGVTLLTADVCGTGLGLYVYDEYAVFPKFYENSRTYRDVLPSLPAAAVEDGGKIVFSPDARVDVARAVGYVTEAGVAYCAAPLRDTTPTARVEFWAVGMGCCAEQGTFECDQVADTAAHAGIRVFDNDGWFSNSNLDYYDKARQKAEATFGMLSSGRALYVRWVREDNLDMLAKHYQSRMIACMVVFIVLYGFASSALAWTLYKPRGSPP